MAKSNGVPAGARQWIELYSRQSVVIDQGFDLGLDWWVEPISELPGGPLTSEEGHTSGRGRISRKYLYSLADDAIADDTGEGALRLLWPTLLWGTGDGNRNNKRRIKAIAKDPARAAILLRDAARLSREKPREAFLTLCPKRNVISYLGPAFFTKFLYFAGGGNPKHPCQIIDMRVLTTIWEETGRLNKVLRPRHNYGVGTYLEAMNVLDGWAKQMSTETRPVATDEMERWAFEPKNG